MSVRSLFGRRFWSAAAAVFLLGSSIALSINFGLNAEVFVVLLFTLPLAAYSIYVFRKYGNAMIAELYEFGVKHYHGKTVTEILFSDVKIMNDETFPIWHRTARYQSKMYYRRIITIIKNDGTKFELCPAVVPKHMKFFDALKSQFDKFKASS